jgi:hypothetical protein
MAGRGKYIDKIIQKDNFQYIGSIKSTGTLQYTYFISRNFT